MIPKRKLETLCIKVAKLTASDQHTQSLIEIAAFFGYQDHKRIFECLQVIDGLENHLCTELSDYRYRKDKELITLIKNDFGREVAEKIYNNL